MIITTGVRHNPRLVYRLIGRELYSASREKLLHEQAYTLVKAVLPMDEIPTEWRVILRGGEVCLQKLA